MEAEAFLDSISDAEMALRIVAPTEAAVCGRETLLQPEGACSSSGAVPTCRRQACPPTSAGRSPTRVRVPGRVVRRGRAVGGRTNEWPRFTLGVLVATSGYAASAAAEALRERRALLVQNDARKRGRETFVFGGMRALNDKLPASQHLGGG